MSGPGLVVIGYGLLALAPSVVLVSRRWARRIAIPGILILGVTAAYREADFKEGTRIVMDQLFKREQPKADRMLRDVQRHLATTTTTTTTATTTTPPG